MVVIQCQIRVRPYEANDMMNGRKLSADPPSAGTETSTHTMRATKVSHCRLDGVRPNPPPPRMPCMKPVT
jgi:hypothetical protein